MSALPDLPASSDKAANAETTSMDTDIESYIELTAEPSLSLTVTPRHAVVGTEASMTTTQVCINVKAGELTSDDRAPVDLIVALDCSGSMDGSKLELCKTTLERIVRFLLPTDRFGLISFASDATIEVPAQEMTAENKKTALAKINSIRAIGSTNISAAIGLAAHEMRSVGEPNEVRTVFLLTDGLANEGITNAASMVELTKNCLVRDLAIDLAATSHSNRSTTPFGGFFKRPSHSSAGRKAPPLASVKAVKSSDVPANITTRTPITLHCFGYGSDHDSELLSTLASSATPGGTYYFVENDKNVGEAFGDALGGVLSVVAQSTVVNISVPPEAATCGFAILDVFHDQMIKRDDGSYSVTVGDFYAEESRDVVFEINLASAEKESTPVPHATVTMSYTDTLQKQPVYVGPITCYISRPTGNEVSEESKHVVVQWLRIATANRMAAAQELGVNNLDGARDLIGSAMQEVTSAPHVQDDPMVIQLVHDMREVQAGLASRETFRSGAHVIRSHCIQHKTQRFSAASAPAAPSVYRGKAKKTMAEAFKLK